MSCAFRQWRAESHCRFIHGYDLKFELEFGANELDACNWVIDFGGLKGLRGELECLYDHRYLVAEDDPEIKNFRSMQQAGVLMLTVLPTVGCEAFAEHVFGVADRWLHRFKFWPRVSLLTVKVSEHEQNSAYYVNPGLAYLSSPPGHSGANRSNHNRVRRREPVSGGAPGDA
jgi:6-pyruvoyltetrahydropterin/6-carboxytetrahydropterin synthase